MNVLFLTLSKNVDINDSQAIYGSILSELVKKKHNVYVVSPVERRNKEKTSLIKNDNYTLLKVKTGNIQKTNIIEKGLSTLLIEKQFKNAIKKHLKNIKFDLILYSTPPITLCNVIKYYKKRDNAKTYLMLKDIFPQNAVDLKMFSKGSIFYKYFRKKEINLYKLSDTIGCMSPKNKEYVIKNNNYLNSNKVEVFPNSINPKKENMRNMKICDEYRKKYHISQNAKVFMYGGNLGKPQGIPFIIECLKKVRNIKNAYFVICGGGTEYAKLEEFKSSSNMVNLLLLNSLPKDEYTKLLNIADVGLIFLDYHFTIPNFPSRLLSYMEKGIPILSCTDKSTDIGDIIEGNNFGWKCYSNDANSFSDLINKICKIDSNELKKLGNNGNKFLNENYKSSKNVDMIFKNDTNVVKHVWIGGVAPKDEFTKLMKIGDSQFAANNMQLLYIEGIEKNIGGDMTIISSHFIPSYFKNKVAVFKRQQKNKWIDIGFINFPILKQITKALNVAKEAKKIVNNNEKSDFVFYIYSMTTPLMYSAKVLKKIAKRKKCNIKIVQIVPDLPQYMNFEKRNIIWKTAKNFDIKIINYLTKFIDKYVLFSPYMTNKLRINSKDYIVIEGMVDYKYSAKNYTKEKVIMYAGGINEEYGVYDLIDAFSRSNLSEYELHLYGPCTDTDKLTNKIIDLKNVKYFGSVSRDVILEKESRATLLVNPRKPNQDFAMYSFPSKTMEYLLSGTPVLMYKLKSMPREYDKFLYYIDENDKCALKKMMFKICNIEIDELNKMGQKASNFILNEKSNVTQTKKIIDFIK